jgi:hypothetical protein
MSPCEKVAVIISKSSTDRRLLFEAIIDLWYEQTPAYKPSSQPFLVRAGQNPAEPWSDIPPRTQTGSS